MRSSNILGVIINRDEDKDQYKIAVKAGILKGLYSRNQFDLCPHRLLTETDVNQENSVFLRLRLVAKDLLNVTALKKRNAK